MIIDPPLGLNQRNSNSAQTLTICQGRLACVPSRSHYKITDIQVAFHLTIFLKLLRICSLSRIQICALQMF